MSDMNTNKTITGFSKLSKRRKIKWIVENFFKDPENVMKELVSYWHNDDKQQEILDGFSENTISNFYMPFGVAPNFIIDGEAMVIPMVIEESSVVAAASSAAKFWMGRGGFKTEIIGTEKIGQVFFKWSGDIVELEKQFDEIKKVLRRDTAAITKNMEARGGGILKIDLINLTDKEDNLYQIRSTFETCDSMGANFINSVLEQFAVTLKEYTADWEHDQAEIVMSILSNYTPNCIVRARVECPIADLGNFGASKLSANEFAEKFATAIKIAEIDPYRATTHNKGIFNGIDAIVLATGNDFRAIEACGHAYASRSGQYSSLSHCSITDGIFKFWLDIPLAVGTVGGLTKLHPIAKRSLELLGSPSAQKLMSIIAVTGLAQNFAAVKSLVTTGIQQGHMKMHLQNILATLDANTDEKTNALTYFADKVVSFNAVRDFISKSRK